MKNEDGKIRLKTDIQGDIVVITPLMNEITFKISQEFLHEVKNVIISEGGNIILDMRNIEIIDSVSLGSLVAIKKYVKHINGELVISNLSNSINELFELLNFKHVFRVYPSLQAGITNFHAG